MSGSEPRVVFERLHPDVEAPERATEESAGYDLRAYLRNRRVRVHRAGSDGECRVEPSAGEEGAPVLRLLPGDRALVPTGFRARLPPGYEAQIRVRSSVALHRGLVVPNAPGTIDADYPDEWFVLLQNASRRERSVKHGERVAQAVLSRYEVIPWEEGRVGNTTDRRGGLGSTGG